MSRSILGEIANLLRPDSDNESDGSTGGRPMGRNIQEWGFRDITHRRPFYNASLEEEQQDWVDVGQEWSRMKTQQPIRFEHRQEQGLISFYSISYTLIDRLFHPSNFLDS